MRLTLMIALASLLSARIASGGVLIYRLTLVEQFVGGGIRVFDKGNNEYDYGAFNFSVQQRDTRFFRFAPPPP